MGAELPLPVSVLLRRAHNAKSPKDRHDTAYFAWEVSVRLAVAARPPEDIARLSRGSVGTWVGALTHSDAALDAPPLLAALRLYSEVAQGKQVSPKSVTARKLLGVLPGYRNKVIGHGSTRESGFYDDAAQVLIEGLEAAWSEHVFLPRGSRLVYAESVELDPEGARRARLLELMGDAGRVMDPRGTAGVPEAMLPQQLYLADGDAYRSLYPWALFRQEEFRERIFFFNGLGRRAEVLDYASGDVLSGKPLEAAFPGAEQALFALFEQQRSDEDAPPEEDPNRFGGYRLLGKLGEGGMGVVYLAEQESLGRLVALKMLPHDLAEDAVALSRFRREVAALSRCDHPNVIKILASGEARGVPYYAMEYVEGSDLSRVAKALGTSEDFQSAVSTASERLRTERTELFEGLPSVPRTPPKEAVRRPRDRYRQLAEALRDAARGVEHLHEAGIVHRDLKPGNLMVTAIDHRVVVMDLGLAMVSDATRSITRDKSQVLGTLRYMPPEQLQRNLLQVDRRADVYSLGATFYELLTEKPFFDGDTEVRLIEQVLKEQPVPPEKANPKIPGDLATIVRKATEKDASLRYESAEALAEDVDAYLEGRPITARPPTLGYFLKLAIRRNKALATTIAAAVLVAVVGSALFMVSLDRARRLALLERARADGKAREAQAQRAKAESERDAKAHALRRARVIGLVAASREVSDRDPLLGLLLARRAVQLEHVPAAVSRVHEALGESHERVRFEHADEVRSASFSVDGLKILTASLDGTARLFDRAGRELATFRGHADGVTSAVFSPDGQMVLTASRDKTARLFDLEGRELAVLRGHEKSVDSAVFSPDGRRIVTASYDKTARLFDLEGREQIVLRGHTSSVESAVFSPDGRWIVTASMDKTARLFDLEGRERAVMRSEDWVYSAVFSPDGQRILTASADDTARLFNLKGKEQAVLRGHTDGITAAVFSPDGQNVLTASLDETARLFDLEGRELAVFRGHTDFVASATFSPDGRRVLTASHDHTVRVFDLAGQPLVRLRGHNGTMWAAVFSSDGRQILTASGDSTARLFDVEGGELGVVRHADEVLCAAFSPDGQRLLTGSMDKTALLSGLDGRPLAMLGGHQVMVRSAVFSPDGQWVLTASSEKTVRLFDSEGKLRSVFSGRGSVVGMAGFSPDGQRIAMDAGGGTVLLVNLSDQELATLKVRPSFLTSVVFSPGGERILTASRYDTTIQLFDFAGRELASLRGHEKGVYSAVFSPDGKWIVTASSDKTARLFDLKGREHAVLRHEERVNSAVFSPDGKRVLTASGKTARLFDLEGRECAVLRGHEAWVGSAAFSPDGRRIVTRSDRAAHLFDTAGKSLASLRGHGEYVRSAMFSPDGRLVLTASSDGTARLWWVHLEDLLRLAEQRITRDFTPEERERYADLLGD